MLSLHDVYSFNKLRQMGREYDFARGPTKKGCDMVIDEMNWQWVRIWTIIRIFLQMTWILYWNISGKNTFDKKMLKLLR